MTYGPSLLRCFKAFVVMLLYIKAGERFAGDADGFRILPSRSRLQVDIPKSLGKFATR